MGRDVEVVAGDHFDNPVLELDPDSSLQHDHPLVLRLVVPKARGRIVALGNDSLDPDAVAYLQNEGELFGEMLGQVGEKVHLQWRWLASGVCSAPQILFGCGDA
jgi:hypothetical protein